MKRVLTKKIMGFVILTISMLSLFSCAHPPKNIEGKGKSYISAWLW